MDSSAESGVYGLWGCQTFGSNQVYRRRGLSFELRRRNGGVLRNQFFSIQKGADQSVYVPSSNSDLYKVTMPISTQNEVQPFPSLFKQNTFDQNKRFSQDIQIGNDVFYNNTRTQLRNTVDMK